MRGRGALAAASVLLAVLLAGCGPKSTEESTVLLPVPDDPTVSLIVWFRVGSQNDPPGKEGLAYLTGRMIAEGATKTRTYPEILKALYPMAASYRIRVDKEMTTLSGRVHRDHLERYLELYTDALLHPAFTEADFRRHRDDALNRIEKSLRFAYDEELGKAALHAAVFDGTRYRHPPLGTVRGIRSITLDDVRAFHAKYFTRGNLVVAVGGGFPDALPDRLRKATRALPEGASKPVGPPAPSRIEGRHVLLVSKPGADASISFGFPVNVHRGEREFYTLWMVNSWLGEHRNGASHLYQVIREERGLNYGDYSYIEAFPEGGFRQMPPVNVGRRAQLFEVWIRTLPNERAVFALRAALREVDRLAARGLTREQFEERRKFLKKYSLHFAESTSVRLGYAVDDRFYGIGGEGHLARFRKTMDELTLDEVNAAAAKYLQTGNLWIAVVTGKADELKRALASGEPTPITYETPPPPDVLEEDRKIAAYPLRIPANNIRVVPVTEMFER